MYLTAGNALVNPQVGLLFIDFEGRKRLRLNGVASRARGRPAARRVSRGAARRPGRGDGGVPELPALHPRVPARRALAVRAARGVPRRPCRPGRRASGPPTSLAAADAAHDPDAESRRTLDGARVFASRRFPDRVRAELERSFEVDLHDSMWPLEREELLRRVGRQGRADADAHRPRRRRAARRGRARSCASSPTTRSAWTTSTSRPAAGAASSSRTRPGVLTRATAELTIALILSLLRRVDRGRPPDPARRGLDLGAEPDARARARRAHARARRPWPDRHGRSRRLALAHGMDVVYSDAQRWAAARRPARRRRRRLAPPAVDRRVTSPDRRGCARPDEAGCGAREHEPRADRRRGRARRRAARGQASPARRSTSSSTSREVHPGLLELENVVLVPHLGSATQETREAMGMLCVEALRAVLLEGRVPENAV